jgi:hypothetical protein
MTKRLIFLGILLFVVLTAAVMTGCGGGGGQVIPPPGLSPNIEPGVAPPAFVGVPYSLGFRWTVNTAKPSYFWNLNGNLPPGLEFDPVNGRIYGTPTTQGAFSFTVVVRDSNSPQREESRAYTITVGPPPGGALTITTTSLPTCKVGVPYMAEILVTGGLPPYNWSMDGNLVPGLSLNPASGKIQGTPTTTGTYTFTARVFDSQVPPATDTQILTINCIDSLQITTESPLPDGEVGVAYFQQLQAKGGVPCVAGPPYNWTFESGFLAPGLTVNANGTITGTPTTPGTYDFLVRVTDCDAPTPETITKNLALTVKLVDADRFVCVDGINGDDAAGDGTSALPFKTITRALAYVSANNMNPSLPRIGAVRIAGPQSGPPLEYHESVTLDTANGTNVSLLGGWYGSTGDFCAFRLPTGTFNSLLVGLGGPAITTNGLAPSVLIEQLSISGDNAISLRSTAIRNNNSSPTIARNQISGGNASGLASISEGIWNNSDSDPLIVENTIYGGIGGAFTRGIFNEGLGTNPEIRANSIDGGDPSGGGTTTSVGIQNQSAASPNIYDNTITGGTGRNAFGIRNENGATATIARNTIDCKGSPDTDVCAAISVTGAGSSATINANRINGNSSTVHNGGVSSRGVWLGSSATASIDGNNLINGGEGDFTAYGILMENGSTAAIGGTIPGQPNSILGGGCVNFSTNDTWGIKVSSGSSATIVGNSVGGGCGLNTSTGIGVDPATANIDRNSIIGNSVVFTTNTTIGIHYNNSTGRITNNVVSGGRGDLAVGILVENGTVANQPVIGLAGAGNIIRGAALSVPNDAIGIWCINAVPTIQNNDLITGTTAANQAIGIFLDDCDNVTVSNNTRIEGGITTNPVAGWTVGIRADFSTGVTISNNPMITGGGSFVSTGILLFSSIATITGNTVNAGAATSVNEGIVFSGSGGTVRNNIIDANGAGGIDAYGIRMFGCANPAMGPAGGNTFQGASGNGRHLWDGNIPNVGSPPFPCGVSPLTVNAAGNTWSEAPPPAGLQCGPGNDSFPLTRNYNILNAGQCIQF